MVANSVTSPLLGASSPTEVELAFRNAVASLGLHELPFILKIVGRGFWLHLNYSLCYYSLHSTGGHSFNLATDIKGIISLLGWTSTLESYVFILPPRVGGWHGRPWSLHGNIAYNKRR